MCSLHFRDCDFVDEHSDSNPRRRRKYKSTKLAKRYLKKDAVPSIFPNAPPHLSSPLPTPRASASAAMASSRRQQEAQRLETLQEMFEAEDNVKSLTPGQKDKLAAESAVPGGFQSLIMDGMLIIIIYWLQPTDTAPGILASITVKTDLTVLLTFDKNEVPTAHYKNLLPGSLDTMLQLLNLMAFIKGWCEKKETVHASLCLDVAIKNLEEHVDSLEDDSDDHRRQTFFSSN
jgi:hypothetical protein